MWNETPDDYGNVKIYAFGSAEFSVTLPGISNCEAYATRSGFVHNLYYGFDDEIMSGADEEDLDTWIALQDTQEKSAVIDDASCQFTVVFNAEGAEFDSHSQIGRRPIFVHEVLDSEGALMGFKAFQFKEL